nr:MAG TPA: hypothetical protein [Caudoviricetes sp.]
MAPRVDALYLLSASSCASVISNCTIASLSPSLRLLPKSSSAQETIDNAMLPTNNADSV